MSERICQDCDMTGDIFDFPEGICCECGGEVVTLAEMEKIREQYRSVTRKKETTWEEQIKGEETF